MLVDLVEPFDLVSVDSSQEGFHCERRYQKESQQGAPGPNSEIEPKTEGDVLLLILEELTDV